MKDINLYLVRHGETEWNVLNQMQGSKNSPLTNNGVQGAKVTGQFLADTPFIKAYSSPQQRAVETRDYILAERNIPRSEHAGLCEMDFGTWEGVFVPELMKVPEFNTYLTSPADYNAAINGGENYPDVLARMKGALEDIVAENDNGNILVVSHGSALRLLIHVLSGGNWHQHRDETICPRVLNTSISKVNYKQEAGKAGKFTVETFNDVNHLA